MLRNRSKCRMKETIPLLTFHNKKVMLKKRKLKTTGNKKALQDRLKVALILESEHSEDEDECDESENEDDQNNNNI